MEACVRGVITKDHYVWVEGNNSDEINIILV